MVKKPKPKPIEALIKKGRARKKLQGYEAQRRAYQKKVVKEMNDASELLKSFGLRLSGWDPGVTAYLMPKKTADGIVNVAQPTGHGFWGEPISLSGVEWEWLRPLLVELKNAREMLEELREKLSEADRQLDDCNDREIDRIRQ